MMSSEEHFFAAEIFANLQRSQKHRQRLYLERARKFLQVVMFCRSFWVKRFWAVDHELRKAFFRSCNFCKNANVLKTSAACISDTRWGILMSLKVLIFCTFFSEEFRSCTWLAQKSMFPQLQVLAKLWKNTGNDYIWIALVNSAVIESGYVLWNCAVLDRSINVCTVSESHKPYRHRVIFSKTKCFFKYRKLRNRCFLSFFFVWDFKFVWNSWFFVQKENRC